MLQLPQRSELIARDGFHPSPLGYEAWADELASTWPVTHGGLQAESS